jgi:protein TonB
MADQTEKTGNPIIDAQQERVAEASGHDTKRMRMALGIALAVHLVFLAVKLPDLTEAQPPEEPEDKPYLVHQVKFRPPPPPPPDQPPPPEPELPSPEAVKIPVPDPTPDEPEPVVEPEPEPEPLPRPEDVIEIVEQPRPQPPQDLPAPDLAVTIPQGPPPAPEPTGPIRVGGDVKAPVKVHAPDPRYTSPAQAARVEGVVIVEAVIDKRGRVTSTKILKDLPMGLGAAAQNAVKTWRFKPATLNGKPVDVYYNLTVNFELD